MKKIGSIVAESTSDQMEKANYIRCWAANNLSKYSKR